MAILCKKSYTLNLFPVVLFIFRLGMFIEWIVPPESIGLFMTHIIKNIITNIDLSCFSIKTDWVMSRSKDKII